jgi:hypothetical protein
MRSWPSRAGDGALAIADFHDFCINKSKACFGEAPKPTREARVLPRIWCDAISVFEPSFPHATT